MRIMVCGKLHEGLKLNLISQFMSQPCTDLSTEGVTAAEKEDFGKGNPGESGWSGLERKLQQ